MSYVLVRRPGPTAAPCGPRRAWRARSAALAYDPAPVPCQVFRLGSSPVLCSHALHPGYVVPGFTWHAPPPGLHAAAALQDACTAHTTAACQASERSAHAATVLRRARLPAGCARAAQAIERDAHGRKLTRGKHRRALPAYFRIIRPASGHSPSDMHAKGAVMTPGLAPFTRGIPRDSASRHSMSLCMCPAN